MVVCWIYAVILALFLLLLPLVPMTGAVETAVSSTGGAFLAGQAKLATDIVSATRIFITPLLTLTIVTAYGLAKDLPWSRWMMMVLLVAGVVLIPPQMASPLNYGLSLALAIFGWWYLYRKPSVVAYYNAISKTATG